MYIQIIQSKESPKGKHNEKKFLNQKPKNTK